MPRPSTTRKRQLAGPRFTGVARWWYKPTGATIQQEVYRVDGRGKQITVSEGHQWPPPEGAKLIDRGGPFYTTKSYVASPRVTPYTKLGPVPPTGGPATHQYQFNGALMPVLPGLKSNSIDLPQYVESTFDTLWPPTLESSNSQLDEKGTTAISRCKPTNSLANLGQTLAETMREGFPALIGASLLKSKTKSLLGKGAGEFLNVSFGWLPLVSDVQKASKAIVHSDEVLAQYERDAGKVVRRSYYFPLEKTESETVIYTNQVPLGFGVLSSAPFTPGLVGRCVRRRVVERKTWFSGAFTYYLPNDYDSRKGISKLRAQADILLGTDLTPELVWNVGPWSWLADWFGNTGDVISNLQDFKTGELVMRYGYVMETVKVSDTYTHEITGNQSSNPRVTPITLVTETKVRRPANPFGFGLSWEGLSSFQQAILAALGITRATR